jgi:carboxypeptidase Taq
VISVQLWDKLRGELPDLDSQFEKGEFGDLAEWLRENLHRHGRKYTSKEMLDRIVGGPMDPGPYLSYLKEKLGEIYGLPVEAGATA